MYFGTPLYWRETHRQPRFLFLDGRLVITLFLMIMHIRLWTVGLALLTILVLWIFERKGVSADSILRYLRASIVGKKRSARGFQSERPMVDFGFETDAMVKRQRDVIRYRAAAAEQAAKKLKPASRKK